jgi:hypothetical protein
MGEVESLSLFFSFQYQSFMVELSLIKWFCLEKTLCVQPPDVLPHPLYQVCLLIFCSIPYARLLVLLLLISMGRILRSLLR